MNLVVEIDARELRSAMKKAPARVVFGLNKWVSRTAFRVEREAKTHVPPNVDTGRLESSIHSRIGYLRAEVAPTAKYAIYVHEGRKPGKMPPFQPGTSLNSWARRKGMNPFLVARSIGRKGTKGNPFMREAFNIVEPIAQRDAQNTLNDIVRAI